MNNFFDFFTKLFLGKNTKNKKEPETEEEPKQEQEQVTKPEEIFEPFVEPEPKQELVPEKEDKNQNIREVITSLEEKIDTLEKEYNVSTRKNKKQKLRETYKEEGLDLNEIIVTEF